MGRKCSNLLPKFYVVLLKRIHLDDNEKYTVIRISPLPDNINREGKGEDFEFLKINYIFCAELSCSL